MQNEETNIYRLTAVYGRVSSSNQENEGTIETQLTAVREYALQQGLLIVKEYTDEGWSGDNLERPSLDQLRMDAKKKIWQSVLIYDPDRLARRYSYQELVTDELREKGIEIIYVTTPAPKTGVEKILFGVQGLFSEYERAKIAERFRLGKVRKAREGNIIATEAPFGYTFIPKKGKRGDDDFMNGFYEINNREAPILKKIFKLVGDDHLTLRGLVRELQKQEISPRKSKRGVWSTSTLSTLLRNKTYIGEGHFGASMAVLPVKPLKSSGYKKIKKTSRRIKPESEWIKIPTPKLISEDLFGRVQERLRLNYELCIKNRKNNYLLAGKIWCNCGRRRAGQGAQNGKHLYYRCTDRVNSFPLPPACIEKGINAREVDDLVWGRLSKLMTNSELLYKMAGKWTELRTKAVSEFIIDINSTKDELKKLRRQEDRYTKAYGMGVLTLEQFQKIIVAVRTKISTLDKQLIEIRSDTSSDSLTVLPDEKDVKAFVEHTSIIIQSLDFLAKKKITDNIINKVTGNREKISVTGKIPLSLNLNYVALCTNGRNSQDATLHFQHSSDGAMKEIPFEFQITRD